ncbi:hypothetical protein INT47_005081 [Mucor saturninus]|uniref:Uncharacterized protein n=1 Tax=Mucor saturninus TaxID=64648 RepID=A0A8H7QVE9_9FUNG|nr:hypothetical protein INT47_005081 [Mucor saturninus]
MIAAHLYQVDHPRICATSQIINEMLGDGSLHHHVEFLRKTHGDRLYEGLLRPMQRDLVPLGCSIPVLPRGGYFVWLKLPIPGNQLMEVTRHHKIEVNVGLGTLFSVTEDTTHYVRLSYANYDTKTLQLGVSRLQQALSIALKTN